MLHYIQYYRIKRNVLFVLFGYLIVFLFVFVYFFFLSSLFVDTTLVDFISNDSWYLYNHLEKASGTNDCERTAVGR